MAKKEVMNPKIQPYTLTNIQIKERIEDAISYDHSNYKNIEILFENKNTNIYKLPFSDFKVAIAQELEEQKMLIKELKQYLMIEENISTEEIRQEPETEIQVEEESEIDILDEIYDFDEETKKPGKTRYKSKVKQVDTAAIVAKIKAEAREKNKGKKRITRRDIDKELKPYLLKKANEADLNDDTLTSIDIYLNAVNQIESNSDGKSHNASSLELNLDDILNDLEK